jgi:prepilin-type processing-associated H-X9-DG protein
LLIPAVQAAREAARRTWCANNLKQLGLAQHNAHDVLNRLVPGADLNLIKVSANRDNSPGWGLAIMPYMEMTALFDTFKATLSDGMSEPEDMADNSNLALAQTVISNYLCPSVGKPEYNVNENPMMFMWYLSEIQWGSTGTFEFTREKSSFTNAFTRYAGGRTHYVAVHGSHENETERNTRYKSFGAYTGGFSFYGSNGFTHYKAGCTESCAANGCMPAVQVKNKPGIYVNFTMIEDGTTNTIMFSEDCASFMSHWAHHFNLLIFKEDHASPINRKPYKPFPHCATGGNIFGETFELYQFHDIRSMHSGGVNSLYADGRVSFTSENTELKMIRLLLNRMDGEMVVLP